MAYIFIDESGDLGFDFSKRKTTRYFIVTGLVTINPRSIEKVMRKFYAGLHKKYRMRHSMIHANEQRGTLNDKICIALAQNDCKIFTIVCDKHDVRSKAVFAKYGYMNSLSQLIDLILSKIHINTLEEVMIVISRRETNKFLNKNIETQLQKIGDKYQCKLHIRFLQSSDEKCLQAVDVASYAIFIKNERNNNVLYKVLLHKIIEIAFKNDKALYAI